MGVVPCTAGGFGYLGELDSGCMVCLSLFAVKAARERSVQYKRNFTNKIIYKFVYYTVPKVIHFPRYNTKCSGENKILKGIFCVASRFPLHFVLYLENFDYFLDSERLVFLERNILHDVSHDVYVI